MSSWSVNSSHSLGRPVLHQPSSVGTYVPSVQPTQAVPVVAGFPTYHQLIIRATFQPPSADFFNSFSSLMSNMLEKVQGIVNTTVSQQSLPSSQDLSQPSGSVTLDDSQEPSLSQDNLDTELQVVDSMPSIPYVQSVNRDYR